MNASMNNKSPLDSKALIEVKNLSFNRGERVIYDDISLDVGQLRIRKKGSAGGHNGIKNIIANLGTDHFMRVKVGVGEKPKNWDLADYVLSPFTKDERPLVNLAIEHAAKAIEQMLNGDVDAAMNEYNRKSANPAE